MDTEQGLAFVDGDKDLYKILLDAYLEENTLEEKPLLELIEKNELEAAAKIVHKAKGASYQIGAKAIGDAGQELESALRGKTELDKIAMKILARGFAADVNKCREEVKNLKL